jgi:hypothetical protein
MFRIANHRYAITLIVFFSVSSGSLAAPTAWNNDFRVFDGLLYNGKPDLSGLGMIAIVQLNQPEGISDSFDDAKTRATMQRIEGFDGVVFLDYEVWPLSGIAPQQVAANIQKFKHVIEIERELAPKARVGYYGLIPCREYWGLVNHDEKKMAEWRECNRQGEQIASAVDVIFPSLYTFYNDPAGWDIFAKGMIEQARRYKKPVYVFLWPEFHVSNFLLRGTNIPPKFWRHQLELCRSLADGIVVWGGWKEQWDETAGWWVETKSFIKSLAQR